LIELLPIAIGLAHRTEAEEVLGFESIDDPCSIIHASTTTTFYITMTFRKWRYRFQVALHGEVFRKEIAMKKDCKTQGSESFASSATAERAATEHGHPTR